jgi:hypothetical protein
MKIFSTLLPEQIDERRTQAEGVLGLKRFLRFAQNNEFIGKERQSGNKESQPIVAQLADAIRRKGYEVHEGVGTSSFKIDVAIVDSANKGRYLLGIICDGHSYYRLKTARDREVVRPTVLRRLGWKIMHVWSVDWILRPESVISEVMKELIL